MRDQTSLFMRLRLLIRRRQAARRFDVQFGRAATFRVPGKVRVNGRTEALNVPDELCQRTAFIEVLLDDCYGIRSIAKRARIERILDIGANVGLFSVAARAAWPSAIIHAYEPNPALEPLLAHQARISGAKVFTEAVGSNSGKVELEVDPLHSVLSRALRSDNGSIPLTAFRVALERIGGSADLVKLDCEGAEWELLSDDMQWRGVRFVSMEYHCRTVDDHVRIREIMDAMAFRVIRHTAATGFGLMIAERRSGASG